MARQDVETTRNDIVISELYGDFKIVESDQAHIEHILEARPGDFKEFPLLGANVFQFLNAPGGLQAVKRKIINQLEGDNYRKIVIIAEGQNLQVNAEPIN